MRKLSFILTMASVVLFLSYGISSPAKTQEKKTLQIATVIVPDLIGKSIKEAEGILRKQGLNYEKAFITAVQAQYQGKEGKVVKQSPEAGKKVTTRMKIWIYIYSPKAKTLVDVEPIQPVKIEVKDIDLTWDERFSFYSPSTYSKPVLVATIKNLGRDEAPTPGNQIEWEVVLYNEKGDEIYKKSDNSVYPIEGGKNKAINFQEIPLNVYKETHSIQLAVDPEKKIPEKKEDNNIIKKRNLPDLRITRIWIEDSGYQYDINADASNIGTRPMPGNFSISWYFDGEKKVSFLGELYPYSPTYRYSINKSQLPPEKKTLVVKLHVNDGIQMGGKIYEELDHKNNVLEVELKLPGR